jgi:hypothetical protein
MKNEIDNAQAEENAQAQEEYNAETKEETTTENTGGIVIVINEIEIELF